MKKLSLLMLMSMMLVSYSFGIEKINIAVMRLDKKTSVDTTSLTEVLQAELAKKKKVFIVVEREKLNQILKEQKLNLAGITQEDAVRLGEILGASIILSGTVSYIDGRYIITVKGLDSSTGVMEWGDTVMSYDKSGLVDIMPTLAHRISLLAQGRTLRAYKLKPVKTKKNQKKSGPSYFSRLMSPPKKRFAWEMGLTFGKYPGFSDSTIVAVTGGFHAPGESFLQTGLDLELGLGSLNSDTGNFSISFSPILGLSLVRTKIFQLHAGLMYQYHIRRISMSLLNTMWFNHHNIGLYADANLIFGRDWSLSLGWKYSLPVAAKLDYSTLDPGAQILMGISQIESDKGLKYHSISLNFNIYK